MGPEYMRPQKRNKVGMERKFISKGTWRENATKDTWMDASDKRTKTSE